MTNHGAFYPSGPRKEPVNLRPPSLTHPVMSARLLSRATVAASLLAASALACAQGKPMDDAALSDTWGQALIDLTNTTTDGYQFSRLTFNADISLSANLSGLKLGTSASGTSDIDISTLNFGRSDSTAAARTVSITNPYFEWVYSGDAGSASRQVVGMRLGFSSISGDVGLLMNTVSGSLSVSTSSGTVSGTGSQLTSLSGSSGTVALSSIGGVTASDSRDFFVSVLKTALTWPTATTGMSASAQAQAGFWLNWTNNLTALNTTGYVPPNVAKIGP